MHKQVSCARRPQPVLAKLQLTRRMFAGGACLALAWTTIAGPTSALAQPVLDPPPAASPDSQSQENRNEIQPTTTRQVAQRNVADEPLQRMADDLNHRLPRTWHAFTAEQMGWDAARRDIVIVPGMYYSFEERPHVVLVFSNESQRPAMPWERPDGKYEYLGRHAQGHAHLFVSDRLPDGSTLKSNLLQWPEAIPFCKAYIQGNQALLQALQALAENRYLADDGWGKQKNQLRARWLLYSSELVVGKKLLVGLDLVNFGSEPQTVPIPQAHPWRSWQVLGPDGQPVAFRPGPPITWNPTYELQPRSSLTLFAGADLAQLFDLSRPGRYTLRFTGEPVRNAGADLQFDVPESQALPTPIDFEFELKAGD